jgi:hypothetical protein
MIFSQTISYTLIFNFSAMSIGSIDQQPKMRYEVITGQPNQPDIILSRPVLDANASVTSISGQTVTMMPQILHQQQPQFITQIPTKQYISSQPSIPFILPEARYNGERNISYPINVMTTSADPVIKLEVTCSTAPSSPNHVLCQPTYVNDITYPKFHATSGSSKMYQNMIPTNIMPNSRAVPIPHIPGNIDFDKMRGIRMADSATSVAMDIQSLYVASNIGSSNKVSYNFPSSQLDDMKIGTLNQALTKMVVDCSGTNNNSPYAGLETSLASLEAVERSSQIYSALSRNTGINDDVSLRSSTADDNQTAVTMTSSPNVDLDPQTKEIRQSNDSIKVEIKI